MGKEAPQWVVNTAERISGSSFPPIEILYSDHYLNKTWDILDTQDLFGWRNTG